MWSSSKGLLIKGSIDYKSGDFFIYPAPSFFFLEDL